MPHPSLVTPIKCLQNLRLQKCLMIAKIVTLTRRLLSPLNYCVSSTKFIIWGSIEFKFTEWLTFAMMWRRDKTAVIEIIIHLFICVLRETQDITFFWQITKHEGGEFSHILTFKNLLNVMPLYEDSMNGVIRSKQNKHAFSIRL